MYAEIKDPAVDLIYLAAEEWATSIRWEPGPSDAEEKRTNTACTQPGIRSSFFCIYLARGFFLFRGQSTLPVGTPHAHPGKIPKARRNSGNTA